MWDGPGWFLLVVIIQKHRGYFSDELVVWEVVLFNNFILDKVEPTNLYKLELLNHIRSASKSRTELLRCFVVTL
jgi:hypothetical protein